MVQHFFNILDPGIMAFCALSTSVLFGTILVYFKIVCYGDPCCITYIIVCISYVLLLMTNKLKVVSILMDFIFC